MELFYSDDIDAGTLTLDGEEAAHCVKVLRHREGDQISVIDGRGTLYSCRLAMASPKGAQAVILDRREGFGVHPYRLTMAVCPTKNSDRFEWFAEKATEIGVDVISPVIGEHSERKVLNTERVRKILLSATKQSLKGTIPQLDEPVKVMDFIAAAPESSLKLIAYCFEGETMRRSIKEVLGDFKGKDLVVMIGPEGDFSPAEASAAIAKGFIPVHLGDSRLRTETAAVTAVEAAYFRYM